MSARMALAIACDIHPLNNLRVLKYLKSEFGQEQPAIDAWYRPLDRRGASPRWRRWRRRAPGQFLFGDTPTIADVCLVPQMYNARRFDVPLDAYPDPCSAPTPTRQRAASLRRAHPTSGASQHEPRRQR